MLKIGQFTDTFLPVVDGVGRVVQAYSETLCKMGNQVTVVAPMYDTGFQGGFPFQLVEYVGSSVPGMKQYKVGEAVLDAHYRHRIRMIDLDLIHAHSPFTAGSEALRLASVRKLPLVATFHSKYRQDFEHNVHCKPIVDWMVRHIIRFFEKADEVWIPQAAVEPTLREYGYKGHVEVVENGNDFYTPKPIIEEMRKEMREELGVLPEETMLLFVGQHIWEKNIGFILDALALIKEQPFQLFMVGTGYAVRDIKHKIGELGLQDKVTLLGNIHDRNRLKKIDAAADLFLFPSLYDNAPLVVREAAAMHTPALMLQESTAAEVSQPDVNGFLTPNDLQQYADRIVYLMHHPDMMAKVGHKASTTISRSWENVMEEVILRYRDIQQSYKLKHGK